MIGYIYEMTNVDDNPFGVQFYYPSQISRAENRLLITSKRRSTTAHEAFLPQNLQQRWNFKNLQYSFGRAGLRYRCIIDLSEARSVYPNGTNRKSGKTKKGQGVDRLGSMNVMQN